MPFATCGVFGGFLAAFCVLRPLHSSAVKRTVRHAPIVLLLAVTERKVTREFANLRGLQAYDMSISDDDSLRKLQQHAGHAGMAHRCDLQGPTARVQHAC